MNKRLQAKTKQQEKNIKRYNRPTEHNYNHKIQTKKFKQNLTKQQQQVNISI